MKDKEIQDLIELAKMGLKIKPSQPEFAIEEKDYHPEETKPKKKKEPTPTDGLNDAQRFIAAFNIKEGKYKVPVRTIIECYRKWSPKPIKIRVFSVQFKMIYMEAGRDRVRYYKLNIHPKTLLDKVSEMVSNREKTKNL